MRFPQGHCLFLDSGTSVIKQLGGATLYCGYQISPCHQVRLLCLLAKVAEEKLFSQLVGIIQSDYMCYLNIRCAEEFVSLIGWLRVCLKSEVVLFMVFLAVNIYYYDFVVRT